MFRENRLIISFLAYNFGNLTRYLYTANLDDMSKLSKKNSSGFAPLIGLFLIAVLSVSGYAFYKEHKSSFSALGIQKILGENVSSVGKVEGTEKPEAVKIETPEPKETPEADIKEAETETEFDVKDGTEAAKIKIRSGNSQFELQQDGSQIQVQSKMPLSVNPKTRELTIETPQGPKVVAILPQTAVDNMLSAGILSTTSNVEFETASDGSMTYKIDGNDNKKFLGLFAVSISKTVNVSAQTGQVVGVNQSSTSKILDILSI